MSVSPSRLALILDFVADRYESNPLETPSHEFQSLLVSAWAPSTCHNYSVSIRRFITFCNKNHYLVSSTSPTPKITICHFIAVLSTTHSASYICTELSALRAFHIFHNLEFPSSLRIQYLLKAANNLAPPSSRRAPCNPVTIPMLDCLILALDPTSPFDACCLAVACYAF
jgi:hypothetical protein